MSPLGRGKPLRRTGGLPRTAPLVARTPLVRHSPLRGAAPGAPRPPFRVQRPTPPSNDKIRAKALLAIRADGHCEGCGRPGEVDPSHRIGAGVGGPWRVGNLIALCRRQHDWLHANPAAARDRYGWRLESTDDYLSEPAWLVAHGWVLLGNDGSVTPTTREVA